jgi:hypothetical protein
MRHLKTFVLSEGRRYQELVPSTQFVSPNRSGDPKSLDGWAYCAATPQRDIALLYFEQDCPQATLSGLSAGHAFKAHWYDPRSGGWLASPSAAPTITVSADGILQLPMFPGGKAKADTDWALKLKRSPAAVRLQRPAGTRGRPEASADRHRLPDTDNLKPRLIVLTDIGGDPDDQQSMIRLMLYSNEFQIEGLIASASGTPGELKQAVTKPHLIREIVNTYGQVRENLSHHADGYPSAEHLRARIKSGNPQRGLGAIGEGCDTEGSRSIMQVVDRPDPRPVNITIWGGQTDLAQALWRIRADRGEQGLREFVKRIRVYDIGDQDQIVDWIWREFPGLFYVLGKAEPGQDKREAVYRGMYLGGDESLTSREWVETHAGQGHGPLGALYPTRTWTAPNPHSTMKEGDTPSWFFFLPNGLNASDHPSWGGWGGRFVRADGRIYRDARDSVAGVTDGRSTVWRWRDAFQRDFQARMDWCVKAPDEANHPPVAVCHDDTTETILTENASPDDTIRLSAAGSRDPDGDALSYRWWVYREAGSYRGEPVIDSSKSPQVSIDLPPRETGDIHLILEVTDNGQPPLTSYRRVIVHVD